MRGILTFVLLGMLAASAPAADIYVATNATPAGPFTNWSGAFTNLQQALDYARTNTGEAVTNIYLAGHIFEGTGVANSVFTWQNCTNQNLRGGYAATNDDTPGARGTNWSTILQRSSGNARVLFMGNLSNCLAEQVTIRNGTAPADNMGCGVHLTNCAEMVFSACNIISNSHGGAVTYYGGGMYIRNSSVTVSNSLIASNACTSGLSNTGRGVGAYLFSGTLNIVGSIVKRNQGRLSGLGGIYGGAFYVGGGVLDIRETVIAANDAASGGGSIYNAGTLRMRNCLVVSNWSATSANGDAIYTSGSSATCTVANCTFADNNTNAIVYAGGAVAISNSIFWGHAQYDLMSFPADASGVLSNVWYCDLGDGQNAGVQGCHSIDPLFADRATYHLQSTNGNYTNSYFSGGSWTSSAANSPLIDRGDPAAAYSNEPEPNGSNLNLGAYGNTAVASKTPGSPANPPAVVNRGALAWGHRTVLLRGVVTNSGGEIPEAWFRYWADGATATNSVGVGLQSNAFEQMVSGLSPGSNYHFLVAASNRAGEVLSAVSNFSLHASPAAFFVATNADNTAGTNWLTAHTNLQAVLNIAEAGDTVYLAGQVFEGAPAYLASSIFSWKNATNMVLRGGYRAAVGEGDDDPPPGLRDRTNYPTILQLASGAARVLIMSNLEDCVVEQVTIRNGAPPSGSEGGGMHLINCAEVVFDACQIVSNAIPYNSKGGGMYVANSSVTVSNSLIATNAASPVGGVSTFGYGGGVYLASGSLNILGSIVQGNYTRRGNAGQGGAFYVVAGGVLDIRETALGANSGDGGGGAIFDLGTLRMRNCLVISNWSATSANGDAIYTSGSSATCTVANCTFADNNTNAIVYAGGQIAVSNSIITGHRQYDLYNLPADGQGRLTTVFYSLFQKFGPVMVDMHGIRGNLVADPQFTNAAAGDCHLLADSPAINAGTNLPWMAGASDLDGLKPRIRNRLVDIGCYEAAPRPGAVWKTR